MLRPLAVGAIALVVGLGCGSEPIPRVAVEGTTISIPVPWLFDVGYGRILSFLNPPDPNDVRNNVTLFADPIDPDLLAFEDLQRGEILAILVENDVPVATLPVRYIAGLNADPSATLDQNLALFRRRQNIIYLDLPLTRHDGSPLVPDSASAPLDFSIELRRFRRNSFFDGNPHFSLIDQSLDPDGLQTEWVGWAGGSTDPEDGISIAIADAHGQDNVSETERFHDEQVWLAGYLNDIFYVTPAPVEPGGGAIAIPDPHFSVELDSAGGPYGAFEFDVTYPAERMVITGTRPDRGSAWVSITPDPSAPPCSSGPSMHTATVRAADSAADITGVIVTFRIREDALGCIFGAVDIGGGLPDSVSVDPASLKVFDIDGAPMPPPSLTLTNRGI